MKSISAELMAHYASGETTLAILAKFTRSDDEYLAVTVGHDSDITYSAITYLTGYDVVPTAMVTSGALNVDTMDIRGVLTGLGISEADINAGLWDNCRFDAIRVNWADLTMGHEEMKSGWFGEISIGRAAFNTELRGLTQKLQSTVGDVVSPSCKNDLFDVKCGVVATEGVKKFSNTAVTGVTSNRHFVISALTQAAGTFDAGKVTWTTGLNAGLSMEIKTHTAGGDLSLQEPMPYNIAITDRATVFVGCLKRLAEDCRDKHDNVLHFGGFPYLPGNDQMFKGV